MKRKKMCIMLCLAFVCLFTFNMNVHADVYCAALPDVVIDDSIADVVHTVIRAIQIVVPIILVVFGMIDMLKGVSSQKEDEIKKGQQTFVKRVIAAALVFFVIAIVKFIISAVSNNSDIMECANCFIEGSNSSSCQGAGSGSSNQSTDDNIKVNV